MIGESPVRAAVGNGPGSCALKDYEQSVGGAGDSTVIWELGIQAVEPTSEERLRIC